MAWLKSSTIEPQQLEYFKSVFLVIPNVPIRTVFADTVTNFNICAVQNNWKSNTMYIAHTKGKIIEVLFKDIFCVHKPGYLTLSHSYVKCLGSDYYMTSF